jgi:hypothetical protein
MLNRTNRTLSANLNRLNLGTRSLVLGASELNGNLTQRVRLAHGTAMRAGMSAESYPSIPPSWSRMGIPAVPGSAAAFVWPFVGHPVRPPVAHVGHAPTPSVRVRPADADCLADTGQGQPQAVSLAGRAKPERFAVKGKRPAEGKAAKAVTLRATRTPAAALLAAAGG